MNIQLNYLTGMIFWYVALNTIVVFLQSYNLFPSFYSWEIGSGTMFGRMSGLTGGPWELPIILSIIIIPILKNKGLRLRNKLFSLSAIVYMILMSGSRSGMVSLLFVIFFSISTSKKNIFLAVLLLFPIVMIFISQSRWAVVLTGEIPASLLMRFQYWEQAISNMELWNYFLGKGLGYTGLYIDGMYVKIFADLGLIGLLAFALYYFKIINNPVLLILIMMNCITLDVFTNSKIMYFVYFATHYLDLLNVNAKGYIDQVRISRYLVRRGSFSLT